jgi:hypothetical protein
MHKIITKAQDVICKNNRNSTKALFLRNITKAKNIFLHKIIAKAQNVTCIQVITKTENAR